jgi:hypothetical protein
MPKGLHYALYKVWSKDQSLTNWSHIRVYQTDKEDLAQQTARLPKPSIQLNIFRIGGPNWEQTHMTEWFNLAD